MIRTLLFVSAVAITLLGIPSSPPVAAQSATLGQQRSLGIAPLRSEIDIEPGTTYSGTFAVRNNGQKPMTINFSAEAFTITNEAYDYSFDQNKAEVDWVSFSQEQVTLGSKESKEIRYTISVPIGTSAGGRYLSLFSTSLPNSDGAGIDSVERLASLLYITINGAVSRSGNLLNVNAPTILFDQGTWSAQIRNSGSTHFRSVYSLSTKTVFGQTVDERSGNNLILPATVRLISSEVPAPRVLGLYKAHYTIGLGDSPSAQIDKWFLYLPPLQTIPLLGLALLIGLRLIRLRHRRVKNRR